MYSHEWVERAAPKENTINNAPFPFEARDLKNAMRQYLHNRRLSWGVAETNNWYASREAGDTEDRIVIPAKSTFEGHNFWQARAIHDTEKRYQSPHGVSRLDAIIVVYPVSPSVFPGEAVVVEGPMCALAAAGLGRLGVALMGNTPPEIVLNHVAVVLSGYRVLFLADKDAIKEAGKITGRLAARGVSVTLRILDSKDLADADHRERQMAVSWSTY